MTPAAAPVAGAVLSGGASTRFGSDKCDASLGGVPLLERVAAALRDGGADPIAAIGAASRAPGSLEVVADRWLHEGPLGGVATALGWSPHPFTVVVAVDLPLLDGSTVAALVHRARRHPSAVSVARAGGRLQPTCACWPAAAAPALRRALDDGERSIRRVLATLDVEPVDVPELVVSDADTPAELAQLDRWSA